MRTGIAGSVPGASEATLSTHRPLHAGAPGALVTEPTSMGDLVFDLLGEEAEGSHVGQLAEAECSVTL